MSTIVHIPDSISVATLPEVAIDESTLELRVMEVMGESLDLVRVQVNQLFKHYAEEFPRAEVSICVDGYGCYTSEGNTLAALDEVMSSGDNIEIAKFVLRLRSAIDPDFQNEYHSKYKGLLNQLCT